MSDLNASEAPVTLRPLFRTVYLPAALFSTGQGAIGPIVVLSGLGLGASLAASGALVAILGIGQIAAAVPAGMLIARIGERTAMVAATGVLMPSLAGCLLAGSVPMLAVALFGVGVAGGIWQLARQSYVTEAVAPQLRARALSLLGGCGRVGMFVGPFLGAAVLHVMGTGGVYWLHLLTAVAATALLALSPALATDHATGREARQAGTGRTRLRAIAAHWPVLRTLGLAIVLIAALRASRQTLLPVWGAHLGLSGQTLSLIFGLAGAVELLLVYPAGSVMDRYGRRWAAIPAMLLFGLGLALLPLAGTATGLAAVAMLLGTANGLSAGIIMTLGADVAPRSGRSEFLGTWRLLDGLGTGGSPLLIGAILSSAPLSAAPITVAVLSVAAAVIIHRWAPS